MNFVTLMQYLEKQNSYEKYLSIVQNTENLKRKVFEILVQVLTMYLK